MHGGVINARNTHHLPNLSLLRPPVTARPIIPGYSTAPHSQRAIYCWLQVWEQTQRTMLLRQTLFALLALPSCLDLSSFVLAQSLVEDLEGKGFDFDVPGSAEFEAATQPCEQRFSLRSWRILMSSSIVNRRYTVNPAVITFPTETSHVADIVSTARTYGYKVAARSGGVRLVFHGETYPSLTNRPLVALIHRLWARR